MIKFKHIMGNKRLLDINSDWKNFVFENAEEEQVKPFVIEQKKNKDFDDSLARFL